MNLIVNSVGDAACISLESVANFVKFNELRTAQIYELNKDQILIFEPKLFPSILTIDYGKCTSNTHRLVNESNDFLLTHFHLDHYKGFRTGFNIYNKKYSFKKFYYQKLPRINDGDKEYYESEKKLAFLIVLNNLFCSYENKNVLDIFNIFDYVDCIDNDDKNRTDKFGFIPVGIGNVIEFGEEKFNVIWPPESLSDKEVDKIKDTYNKLSDIDYIKDEFECFCNSIKAIEDTDSDKDIYNNENINTKELIETKHSKIDLLMSAKSYFKELESENLKSQRKENLLQFLKNNTEVVEKIKKKITDIANDLSVCIANAELLSLGDLDKNINKCIDGYKNKINTDFIDVKYFITAHHGTHWDKSCQNVKADYVISSNGRARFGDFKNNYLYSLKDEFINSVDIRTRLHNTFVDGDFVAKEE